jgi:transposase-like protein
MEEDMSIENTKDMHFAKHYNSITNEILSILHNSHNFKGLYCPECSSHNVIKNGKVSGRQRYKCKDCNRTFNDLTKTPFAGLHELEKLPIYISCMLAGKSLRESAKIAKVSLKKSFYLRHKLTAVISSLRLPMQNSVVEIKSLEQNYSYKGQRKNTVSSEMFNRKTTIIFSCDRKNKICSDVSNTESVINNKLICKVILKDDRQKEICITQNDAINKVLRNKKLDLIYPKTRASEFYNTDRIESQVSNWEKWMSKFHGVATKYLRNYLLWFDFIINSQHKENQSKTFTKTLANISFRYRYKDIVKLKV